MGLSCITYRTVMVSLTTMSEATHGSAQDGNKAATAAARVLNNPKATKAAKTAAGSALSQTGRVAKTGKVAASAAGKALSAQKTSPRGRKAAGSALAQSPRKKAKSVAK